MCRVYISLVLNVYIYIIARFKTKKYTSLYIWNLIYLNTIFIKSIYFHVSGYQNVIFDILYIGHLFNLL